MKNSARLYNTFHHDDKDYERVGLVSHTGHPPVMSYHNSI